MTVYPREQITGVVLAGGRSRRMGGQDKGLVELAGRAMVAHVVAALRPQVGALVINANRNQETYARLGYPVVPDGVGDYFGPLAGMASTMQEAGTRYILTAPCDSPLLPADLAERLYDAMSREHAEIAVAHDGQRMQPVFALLRCDLLDSVLAFLGSGERKIDRWYTQHRSALADFADRPETFLNVNTPAERATLEERLEANA